MARGRNSNKMVRREPAVMQMNVVIPTGTSFIDLNLCASILNRRAYKQQNTNWAVAEFELLGSGIGTVTIGKLPETWVLENSYQKSLALWNKMNDQVLDDEPSIKGKYSDFKIYLNSDMQAETIQSIGNPAGKILTPVVGGDFTQGDYTGAAPPRADWEWSQLTIPNDPVTGTSTSYYIHVIGDDTPTSKGMIVGYAASRSRPQPNDPNIPTQNGWMTQLFDDGEQLDELKDIIEGDNNRPPYPVGSPSTATEFYPGGASELNGPQVHSFCEFTNTTVSGKNRIQGGMFGLGLIIIENSTGESLNTVIHMMPGNHRGYLVEELC